MPADRPNDLIWQQRAISVISALHRVGNAANNQVIRLRRQSALQPSLVRTLCHICSSEGLTMQDLACGLKIHQSTASNLVEKLEDAGLVVKKREKSDRRIVTLYLSQAGKLKVEEVRTHTQLAFPQAVRHLSVQDLEILEQAVSVMERRLGLQATSNPEE